MTTRQFQEVTLLKLSFAIVAKHNFQYYPPAYWLSSIDLKGNTIDVVQAVNTWLSEIENNSSLAMYHVHEVSMFGVAEYFVKFLPDVDQGLGLVVFVQFGIRKEMADNRTPRISLPYLAPTPFGDRTSVLSC